MSVVETRMGIAAFFFFFTRSSWGSDLHYFILYFMIGYGRTEISYVVFGKRFKV